MSQCSLLTFQSSAATECDLAIKNYFEEALRHYNAAYGQAETLYIGELKRSEVLLSKLNEADTLGCSGQTENELFLLKIALKDYMEKVRPISSGEF